MSSINDHLSLLQEVGTGFGDRFASAENALDLLNVTLDFSDFTKYVYSDNFENDEHEHEFCVADMTVIAVAIASTILGKFKPSIFGFEQANLFDSIYSDEDPSEVSEHIYEPCGYECDDCEYKDECDEFEVNK